MGWNCYICNIERVYTQYFCEDCSKIRRIIDVYGKERIRNILETVCLRTTTKQDIKTVEIKKDMNDGNYDIMMKELKEKITNKEID